MPRTPLSIAVLIVAVGAVAFAGWKIYKTTRAVQAQVTEAQRTSVRLEQETLRRALDEFQLRFAGGPPPDNAPQSIERQFRRMFFRYTGDPIKDLAAEGLMLDKLDDAEQLVFWLGGLREKPDSLKLIGFSQNPSSPFDRSSPGIPFFAFDSTRLVDADGDHWLEYQTPPLGAKRSVYKLGVQKPDGLPEVIVAE